jgi:hypothetical protein
MRKSISEGELIAFSSFSNQFTAGIIGFLSIASDSGWFNSVHRPH